MIRVFLGKPPRPNLAYQALQKRVYKGFLDFFLDFLDFFLPPSHPWQKQESLVVLSF